MRIAILNLILKGIGRQCNCMSAGVTWSRGRRPKTSRAAAPVMAILLRPAQVGVLPIRRLSIFAQSHFAESLFTGMNKLSGCKLHTTLTSLKASRYTALGAKADGDSTGAANTCPRCIYQRIVAQIPNIPQAACSNLPIHA